MNGANPNAVFQYVTEFYDRCPERAEHDWSQATRWPLQIALEIGDKEMFEVLSEDQALFPDSSRCLGIEFGPIMHHCENERCWNPVVNAIKGGNKNLVLQILDIAREKKKPWMTSESLSRCAEKFEWKFVQEILEKYHFPQEALYQRVFLERSILENSTKIVKGAFRRKQLHFEDALFLFSVAARHGRDEIVAFILGYGYWPDDIDRDHWLSTPLEEAFRGGNKNVIGLMVNHYKSSLHNANHPELNGHFLRAYGIAITFGHDDMVEMIASSVGASKVLITELYRTQSFRSSVQHALQTGKYETAEWLLEHGVDANNLEGDPGPSALQLATQQGNVVMVKKLLERGANVNAMPTPKFGATAIQFAAIDGHFEILDILIQAGADINAEPAPDDGRSAIEGAAERGRLDMVSYLLHAGADVRGKSSPNYIRAVYRAWREGHWTLARMIQKWKAEQDKEYSVDCHSIDVISKLSKSESEALGLYGYHAYPS